MLLLKLRDDIRTAMSRSEVTLSILIDYSKAFDTIDHRILLTKLQNMKNTIKNFLILPSQTLPLCTKQGQEINPTAYLFWCTSGKYTRPCTI